MTAQVRLVIINFMKICLFLLVLLLTFSWGGLAVAQPVEQPAAALTPGAPTVAERAIMQSMMRMLIARGIYPASILTDFQSGKIQPVTRAAFAEVLVKTLGHQTDSVSEFPFYRDVPLTHWAYKPIEVVRERKLLTNVGGGFFRPDAPIRNLDVYLALAQSLAGKNPSLELANEILKSFPDASTIPEEFRPQVARLVNARIIVPRVSGSSWGLAPYGAMNYARLSAMLSREMEITGFDRFVLPVQQAELPMVPAGLRLLVVPNGALFKTRLAVGDTVYFSLTEPVETRLAENLLILSRGSRLVGEMGKSVNGNAYPVIFKRLETPEGSKFNIHGSLILGFNEKDPNAFIVPGDPIDFFTTPE